MSARWASVFKCIPHVLFVNYIYMLHFIEVEALEGAVHSGLFQCNNEILVGYTVCTSWKVN